MRMHELIRPDCASHASNNLCYTRTITPFELQCVSSGQGGSSMCHFPTRTLALLSLLALILTACGQPTPTTQPGTSATASGGASASTAPETPAASAASTT